MFKTLCSKFRVALRGFHWLTFTHLVSARLQSLMVPSPEQVPMICISAKPKKTPLSTFCNQLGNELSYLIMRSKLHAPYCPTMTAEHSLQTKWFCLPDLQYRVMEGDQSQHVSFSRHLSSFVRASRSDPLVVRRHGDILYPLLVGNFGAHSLQWINRMIIIIGFHYVPDLKGQIFAARNHKTPFGAPRMNKIVLMFCNTMKRPGDVPRKGNSTDGTCMTGRKCHTFYRAFGFTESPQSYISILN